MKRKQSSINGIIIITQTNFPKKRNNSGIIITNKRKQSSNSGIVKLSKKELTFNKLSCIKKKNPNPRENKTTIDTDRTAWYKYCL